MILDALFKLGIRDDMDTEDRRVTIFSNIVYVIVAVLLTIYLIFYIPGFIKVKTFRTQHFIPWVTWAIALLAIGLNALGRYRLSKIFFMSVWILFVNILPPWVGTPKVINYFMHPIYAIASCIMVHLMFSYYRERVTYFFFLIIAGGLAVFSFEYLNLAGGQGDIEEFMPGGFFATRILILMVIAFFNAAIIYVIRINQQFYSSLQNRNKIISDQNKLLEAQGASLKEVTNKLEEKVIERTQRLQAQNNQLREYTFFNSHILRAPVSRIRGLLNLLSQDIDEEEKQRIRLLLAENMNELDTAIKSINDKLQKVESHEEV